jgi:hypothetical protein
LEKLRDGSSAFVTEPRRLSPHTTRSRWLEPQWLLAVPEVLDAASRELAANAVWYEERRSGYGSRFIDEAEDIFRLLDESPLLGPPWVLEGVPPGVRHVVLRTFPVSVIYVTDPRVVVVAFLGNQEPLYWIDRLDEVR